MVKKLLSVDHSFKNLCAAGTALAIVASLTGCASTHSLTKQQANFPKDQVDAKGLFAENCAACHGADGRAKTFHGRILRAQNLASPRWQAMASDEEIRHAIKTGPGPMPSFEKKLSGSEIEALAAYVRSFKPAQ